MSIDFVLAQLRSIYGGDDEGGRLTKADVQRWISATGLSVAVLSDEIAASLVRGFHQRTLSFEFCDGVMNHLYAVLLDMEGKWHPLFWKAYLAFDAGEFVHPERPDEDPVEAYTRPMVAEIIAELPA